jgi:hypothetical protein
MRLVRLVQSGPLETRIATLLRKSASARRPSGCPAKTFKIVTWKLTVATSKTPEHNSEGTPGARVNFFKA